VADELVGLMNICSFMATTRYELKQRVQRCVIRLLLGSDAASEGLILQRL
jgi:hypothetical protein